MKKYSYQLTTSVIWLSFDNGEVEAEDAEDALILARNKIQFELDKVNRVLATIGDGINIDMNLDQIEIEEIKPKSQFKEIKTDFEDDNGVTHIDGYRTGDDNEEGCVIGYFIFNEVYWRDPEYQFDPYVAEVVKELKSGVIK